MKKRKLGKNRTVLGAALAVGWLAALTLRADTIYPAPVEEAGVYRGSCPSDQSSTAVAPLVQATLQQLVSLPGIDAFWSSEQHLKALLEQIAELSADGLNPQDYQYPDLEKLVEARAEGKRLAGCNIEMVNIAYLSALRDLHFGRLDPARQKLIWYAPGMHREPSEPELLELAKLGLQQGIDQAFTAARPSLPVYLKIRDSYRQALQNFPERWSPVPAGPLLSFGDVDARVPAIKRRLREGGYLDPLSPGELDDEVFSARLNDAVVAFQRRHSLREDGIVGPYTTAALNIQPQERLAQLKVNLERLRWFSRDRESNMVVVDIAGAEVSYFQDGVRRMLTRAQAGRPNRETPTLKSAISHVTLNPTWTVPPTILRKDVLPAVREDVGYLASKHIRVFDTKGKELDPQTINWYRPGSVILRQDAGPGAALGAVALRFANPFSVYLHDTPNQKLFDTSSRFYSSGCVRVENAMTLTEMLFESASPETIDAFNTIRASLKTRNVQLPARVPLLMVYWTAGKGEDGDIRFRPDIYHRDKPLLALLESPQ